jgi:ubiquinone/menaquinone biosynthesis C-methylase UbiE
MALCGTPTSDTGTCRWIEGDALDLPFTDCYFDAVTVGYGLRNVVDKSKAMQEIYRVLKPGWIVVKILFKYCFVSNLDKFSELCSY